MWRLLSLPDWLNPAGALKVWLAPSDQSLGIQRCSTAVFQLPCIRAISAKLAMFAA